MKVARLRDARKVRQKRSRARAATYKSQWGVWGIALPCAFASAVAAQEIAPFKLIGVDGHVLASYLNDRVSSGQSGSRQSRQGQSDMREELFLMTHSYVYHPNFMLLDVGGGPIYQRATFDSDSGETRSQRPLYNLSARASFLQQKPYRGSVYYEHLNPTLSVGPGQIITQENTRYGFDASVLAPFSPIPVHVEANRANSQGRGADRIIDDRVDRFSLRATQAYGVRGSTLVRYIAVRQDSLSGSVNLPIQATSYSSQEFGADSRFNFGAEREYEITNLITLSSQDYVLSQGIVPQQRDLRFLLNARARHTGTLHSFANYAHTTSDQGTLRSVADSVTAGVTYLPLTGLSLAGGIQANQSHNNQLSTRSSGGNGAVRYHTALPIGTAQISYNMRYVAHDQQASAPQANIIGERITLSGTTEVPLSNSRVNAGSVVVTNSTRTQTYVEGFDYILSVIGLQTRVQRLIGGNIADGQEVLVDYEFDVGGTFAYNQLDQNVSFNWSLRNYVKLYYRFSDSAPRLTSGAPSSPLNSVRSNLYGARADVPLRGLLDITIGGSYEHEDRRETISPYQRDSYDAYLETVEPFFERGSVRIGTRRSRLTYDNSASGIDLHGYDVRLQARHPLGIDFFAEASYEQDSGGVTPRSRTTASVKAQWRYRKLTLSADLGRSRETQGVVDHDRTHVQFLLRRDIGR